MPLLPPFGLHSFDLGLGLGGRAVQPVPRVVLALVPGCAVPRVSVRCLGGSTAQSHGNPRPVLPVDAVRYYRCLPGTGSTASIHQSVPDERYNRSPKRFYRGVRTGLYILDGAEGLSFPFVLVPLFLALAAGHLYPCPGVRLALRILGSPWILSVEAFRSLPMDGGNASCSLPLDFFRVLPCLGLYLSFRV